MNDKTQELVETQETPAAIVRDSGSMLSMIGQMAASPECDIDKIERLMAMQLQMQDRENEAAFNAALSSAQSEIGVVMKNQYNEQTRSNYADLGAIVKSITPVYTKYGINLSFDSGEMKEGMIPVICHVSACGHTRKYHYDSPLTDKGIKGTTMMTNAHAHGSAISYGRRYLTCMIFNIATADDDGNSACIEYITAEQAANIRALIEEVNANEINFLKWLKADSIEHIQASAYDVCVNQLERKRKQ